jgi:flagellum-specific peptidoglycan hydrolase FlgJ
MNLILFIITLFFATPAHVTSFQERFAPLAQSMSERYGIPASVQLGISAVESGWGTSEGARKHNAYFGISGRYNSSYWISQDGETRAYPNAWESFNDFGIHITTKPYYNRCKSCTTSEEWVDCISESYVGVYASAEAKKRYRDKVMNVINREGLRKYD